MASKRCSLGRSLNTNVNTIKKTFRAVSRGAEFHLCLLIQNTVFTQFYVAGDAPSNSPCVTKACKEYISNCPSLICYNLIESSSKYFKVVKFSVTNYPSNSTSCYVEYFLEPPISHWISWERLLQESIWGLAPSKLQLKSNSYSIEVHTSHPLTLLSSHQTTWCGLYLSL